MSPCYLVFALPDDAFEQIKEKQRELDKDKRRQNAAQIP